jgi:hypothetical protein
LLFLIPEDMEEDLVKKAATKMTEMISARMVGSVSLI